MRRIAATLVCLSLLLAAEVAAAAQRYAAPNGSGTACSQAAPCPLPEAITNATSNDEVIVMAGSYSVGATLAPKAPDVYVHGDFSGPMPKIVGTGVGYVPIGVPAAGGRLSYLEITNSSGPKSFAASCQNGGSIDRVRLVVEGSEATALFLIGECAVRDSVILAKGTSSPAFVAYAYLPSTVATLARNLTVIATGSGSVGIRAEYTAAVIPGSYILDLKNSIVSGEASDLTALKGSVGSGHIVVSNSNFDSATTTGAATITGGPNQTAPPVFVDAAGGDYREAPGSPTIDAGVADQIGALDLQGNPRALGAAPDIGAFEFVPPSAASPSAASIESLAISPKRFRALKAGAAVASQDGASRAPRGATIRYFLSAAGTVSFRVERALKGRRVGRKCVKQTPANREQRKCTRYKPLKGSFTHQGAAGQNSFKFSGRMSGKALPAGAYRLVAETGVSIRRASFRILR